MTNRGASVGRPQPATPTEAAIVIVKKYRFVKTVKVAGEVRKTGDLVNEDEIPAGNLASLLRLEQVVEFKGSDPAEQFAAALEAASRGQLVTLRAGLDFVHTDTAPLLAEVERLKVELAEYQEDERKELEVIAGGDPTLANRQTAAAEIERLRGAMENRSTQLTAAVAERDRVIAELEAAKPKTASSSPDPEPPVDAKAKSPVVGPSKPPDLKAHGSAKK